MHWFKLSLLTAFAEGIPGNTARPYNPQLGPDIDEVTRRDLVQLDDMTDQTQCVLYRILEEFAGYHSPNFLSVYGETPNNELHISDEEVNAWSQSICELRMIDIDSCRLLKSIYQRIGDVADEEELIQYALASTQIQALLSVGRLAVPKMLVWLRFAFSSSSPIEEEDQCSMSSYEWLSYVSDRKLYYCA